MYDLYLFYLMLLHISFGFRSHDIYLFHIKYLSGILKQNSTRFPIKNFNLPSTQGLPIRTLPVSSLQPHEEKATSRGEEGKARERGGHEPQGQQNCTLVSPSALGRGAWFYTVSHGARQPIAHRGDWRISGRPSPSSQNRKLVGFGFVPFNIFRLSRSAFTLHSTVSFRGQRSHDGHRVCSILLSELEFTNLKSGDS